MKTILLTQGKAAIIDDLDFSETSKDKWCLYKTPWGQNYAVRSKNGRIIYMHRQILGLVHGDGIEVDHINHDGLDNRRTNIRQCNSGQNKANKKYGKKNRKFKFKGIKKQKEECKRPYMAMITVNGVSRYLGSFRTEEEAALAYDAAAIKAHGVFAHLNFPIKSS